MSERVFQTDDGVALAVYEQDGSGVPVLFQHGLGGDQQQCQEAFPKTDYGHRVTVECRGHGGSGMGSFDAISLVRFADDLIHFIESSFTTPVVVGGISMGAALSLRIAMTRPELVCGLILVRPAWLLDAAPENLQPNALVGDLLMQNDVADAESRFLASPTCAMLDEVAPDNLASLRSFFHRPDAQRFGLILSRIANDGLGITPEIVRATLARHALPVCIMGTCDDFIHPLSLAQAMAELLGSGPVVQLPSKQHDKSAYLQTCRQVINDFLRQIDEQVPGST